MSTSACTTASDMIENESEYYFTTEYSPRDTRFTPEVHAALAHAEKVRHRLSHLGSSDVYRIGNGSFRVTYKVGERSVLKLAYNPAGVDCNRIEAAIYAQSVDGWYESHSHGSKYKVRVAPCALMDYGGGVLLMDYLGSCPHGEEIPEWQSWASDGGQGAWDREGNFRLYDYAYEALPVGFKRIPNTGWSASVRRYGKKESANALRVRQGKPRVSFPPTYDFGGIYAGF
jgi:hypothetical protein